MKKNDSVTVIHNIGEQRAMKLGLLGIYTVGDLIGHFPRDYEDRSVITPINNLEPETTATILALIPGPGEIKTLRRNKLIVTRAVAADSSGKIEIVWFNQGYLKHNFVAGQAYYFTGNISEKNGKLQMVSPDYEKQTAESLNNGRIVPVYPLTYKLTQKMLRGYIKEALDGLLPEEEDFLPEAFRKSYALCSREFAVHNIHFPESREAFFEARRRLVFEEFLLLILGLYTIKGISKSDSTGIQIKDTDFSDFNLAFQLTNAQARVIDEMRQDFGSGYAMYRLVQGDVGSGKTAVSMIACHLAVKNGYQSAVMAPTEVLARQHYESFCECFSPYGIEIVFLSGALKKREKEEVLAKIEDGSAGIVIGTHAVIQKGVLFHRLGVVVTDEQHRFGVKQRATLAKKGENPHVLVMSATPIPRTLALVLYGDLDISVIDELPPGRKPVETIYVNSSYRERIYAFIKNEIDKGRQAYMICPSIESGENEEIKSVVNYTGDVQDRYLKGYNVSYLHGKMKADEKLAVMSDFLTGRTNAVVSTTVIEVGVNVPNASIMLIENADRFGLSQLHQLRGRVGRGGHQSYCILVSDTKGAVAKKRLNAMTKTNDGFEISELDLKLRGPGDFFGTKQHGLPELKIANIYKDTALLSEAQNAASALFETGEFTKSPRWKGLRQAIAGFINGPLEP